MRTIFENKQVTLNELSDDQIAIVSAERKLNAAKRRRPETERQLQRLRDDAALFGKPVDPSEIRLLEHQLRQDDELIAQCERELADAKAEPERRAKQEKRGTELKRDMKILDGRIEAAFESIAPLMLEADSLIQSVINEFTQSRGGWNLTLPPFKDDDARTLLERLRFWARERNERGAEETFSEKIRRYRALNETPKPVAQPKPVDPSRLGVYVRSKPLSRKALENSRARLTLGPSGVTETSR